MILLLLCGGSTSKRKVEQVRFRLSDAFKVRIVAMGIFLHQIVLLDLLPFFLHAEVMRLHHLRLLVLIICLPITVEGIIVV